MPARQADLKSVGCKLLGRGMNGAENGNTGQLQVPAGGQQPLAPGGVAAQWAHNVAGMQALYKQSQPPGAQLLSSPQLAAYYANAAQLTVRPLRVAYSPMF